MDVSVVIPTYNRAALLTRTIPALMEQQCGTRTYEVIFVVNGSSDASQAVLAEAEARYPGRLRFFYIQPTGGPSAPRNRGIREAKGDVIVILDDDVLPDPGLVSAHAEYHHCFPKREDAALGELYVPNELLSDPMTVFHTFPYHEVRHLDRLSYLHFWTCNVSMKRDFMLRSGMFDEAFLGYEDIICGHRLTANGMHLRFLPSARGQHLHQIKPAGVATKGEWYGRWLYALAEHLPERDIKIRFGLLSPEIGAPLLFRRAIHRIGFRMVDNPVTIWILKLLGAQRGIRSRITDFYYYLIFRRNLLAGYYQARREARAGRDAGARRSAAGWTARGE